VIFLTKNIDFFASAPRGIEPFLGEELKVLGVKEVRPARAGVYFKCDLETAYRACLWSRLASRILMPIDSFSAGNAEQLYLGSRAIPWEEHFPLSGTFAVDAVGSTATIHHSKFAALKVKDAIADRFRDRFGARPSVALNQPSLRVHVRLYRERATLSLDLSGESLHRRGYRSEGGLAPLKENLAAAILRCAGWPEAFSRDAPLLDPMCGSGTLVIEAGLMAGDIAPGLLRTYFGFLGWAGHQPSLWERLLNEARDRRDSGKSVRPPLVGMDTSPRAVTAAKINADHAGLGETVRFRPGDIDRIRRPHPLENTGLLVTNPPYGERLGDQATLLHLYRTLGDRLQAEFAGWRGAIFIGNPSLESALGLEPDRVHDFYNGALPCRLLEFDPILPPSTSAPTRIPEARGGEMFHNRLKKNLKKLGRWARKEDISCYRLYDADIPEFAVAIDRYDRWIHVQEYAPPSAIDPAEAETRLNYILSVLPELLQVSPENIFLKVRQRQKGGGQYQPFSDRGVFYEVEEGGLKFLVNLTDYLDTGLFLDHRPTRRWLSEMAAGKRFLNLYAYTGTATVFAAAGGATKTVSVDLSGTYLKWAERNLALNGFSRDVHRLVRADCREWLSEAKERRERFDLVFLDPPTFSRSKNMEGTLDIQRDHVELIATAGELLAPGGQLVFSTNFRRFKLDEPGLTDLGFMTVDMTGKTLDPDFQRKPPIHRCWLIKALR